MTPQTYCFACAIAQTPDPPSVPWVPSTHPSTQTCDTPSDPQVAPTHPSVKASAMLLFLCALHQHGRTSMVCESKYSLENCYVIGMSWQVYTVNYLVEGL